MPHPRPAHTQIFFHILKTSKFFRRLFQGKAKEIQCLTISFSIRHTNNTCAGISVCCKENDEYKYLFEHRFFFGFQGKVFNARYEIR